jgi:NAD(P)-dependent dehydrogenase (short-subunit alcohol dehydrogenase family)
MSPSNTPAVSSAQRRQIGPDLHRTGFIRFMNRVLSPILRSPLHWPVSKALLLVEFTGRKTGKHYSIPIEYRRRGNVISFHTAAPWWKNLRGGAPVRLWLGGRPVNSTAEVITDPVVVAGEMAREIAVVLKRAPRLARFYGVRIEPDGRLNPADLAELARKTAVVRVRIPDALATALDQNNKDVQGAEGRDESMRGKVVMVTGANAGIGKATALALAKQGATVVMVSRNRARGELAVEEVVARSGNPQVELLVADFASQASVRQLARNFLARHDKLDVLINNAGVYMPQRQLTPDGLETTIATNYLAPFLLTQLLLPALQAATPSRIVNVSSGAQAVGRIDLAGLRGARRYGGLRAYANSKLAVVTWTYELARRLSGTGVTANALEPGFVDTKLPSAMIPLPASLARTISRPFMIPPAEGARSSVYLASSPRAQSHSGNFFSSKGLPIRSAKQSYDRELAQRLWQESELLTGAAARTPAAITTNRDVARG